VAQGRPNSRIHGVQIGVITGSFSGMTAEQMIPAMQTIGLGEVELQSNHAEALAGAPVPTPNPPAAPLALNADGLLPRCAALPLVMPLRTSGGEFVQPPPTPEQQAAQQRLWEWRRRATDETWRAVRRRFDEAGIDLRILWYGLGFNAPPDPTDEEIDYAFRMARGLGVRAVAGSTQIRFAPRIAQAAAKYGLTWAGHTQDNIHNPEQLATPEAYERFLGLSDRLRISLDIGYFTAAGFDSVPFIQKHHRRITEIHLKDRKRSRSLGGDVTSNVVNNWPFGQGDTPIREVLQLLKRERWDIPVQLEFIYQCRTTAVAVTELARSYRYCRECLEA
jgi:sugar phosphate isomerase/epimerase